MTPAYATCDRTGAVSAIAEGWYVYEMATKRWLFCCKAAPELANDYQIPASEFSRQPRLTVNWLAHLSEKSWFDAADFVKFFEHLRQNADKTKQPAP